MSKWSRYLDRRCRQGSEWWDRRQREMDERCAEGWKADHTGGGNWAMAQHFTHPTGGKMWVWITDDHTQIPVAGDTGLCLGLYAEDAEEHGLSIWDESILGIDKLSYQQAVELGANLARACQARADVSDVLAEARRFVDAHEHAYMVNDEQLPFIREEIEDPMPEEEER